MRLRFTLCCLSAMAMLLSGLTLRRPALATPDSNGATTTTTVTNEAANGPARAPKPGTTVKRNPDGTTVVTTVTTTGPAITIDYDSKQSRAEVRAIRAYCAGVDRSIARNYGARRDFVRAIDESTSRWAGWAEVTGDRVAYLNAIAGAWTYTRNGNCTFVECFGRYRPNRPPNLIRYYFRPDRTLAKTHTILRAFSNEELNGKLIVSMEFFHDEQSNSVGENVEYRNPTTGKRIKEVKYGTNTMVGFSPTSIRRLRDFPFFDLLQKPR